MNRKEKELSFEEALAGLGSAVQALNREDTPLDEAIAKYEEGVAYYNRCNEILSEAKQKIQQLQSERTSVSERLNYLKKDLIKAHPRARSTKFNNALTELKIKIKEKSGKKK